MILILIESFYVATKGALNCCLSAPLTTISFPIQSSTCFLTLLAFKSQNCVNAAPGLRRLPPSLKCFHRKEVLNTVIVTVDIRHLCFLPAPVWAMVLVIIPMFTSTVITSWLMPSTYLYENHGHYSPLSSPSPPSTWSSPSSSPKNDRCHHRHHH